MTPRLDPAVRLYRAEKAKRGPRLAAERAELMRRVNDRIRREEEMAAALVAAARRGALRTNTGAAFSLVSMGAIRRAVIAERRTPGRPGGKVPPVQPTADGLCGVCEARPVSCAGRCKPCDTYRRRRGRARPTTIDAAHRARREA